MLLPLQGVLLFSLRTPKALPWAMCFLGFQPVELSYDTPSYGGHWALPFRFAPATFGSARPCHAHFRPCMPIYIPSSTKLAVSYMAQK